MEIRTVRPEDIPAVSDIYNHYVQTSTCTFAVAPEGPAYWDAWLAAHVAAHPAIVAVEADRIVGWGTLSRWNSRCAYSFTVEDSVYVHPKCHGQGIGRAILADLIRRARLLGHRSIIAQIADHQQASERLHERCGFEQVGCLRGVGHKFDRWIDVAIWQLCLEPAPRIGERHDH